jgi:hypothetical protein
MSSATEFAISPHQSAVIDGAHIGHINGALGTIRHGDIAPRTGWGAKLKTLLAILGPGLIVMVGDNDAGAFGTYTQAGQDYGTTLKRAGGQGRGRKDAHSSPLISPGQLPACRSQSEEGPHVGAPRQPHSTSGAWR